MFTHYFTKHLKEGEEIICLVRRYYLTYAFHIFLSLVFILLPFFFLYPLFRWGTAGIIIFFLALVFGIIFALRQTVIYYQNALVVTKERILDFDQKGLFERVVSESTYEKIQDVSFRIKGVMPTLFNYGDLEIQTAGSQANLEIKDIAEPQKVQDTIIRIQREVASQKTPDDLTAKELIDLVMRIKKGMTDEQFQKLITSEEIARKNQKRPKK